MYSGVRKTSQLAGDDSQLAQGLIGTTFYAVTKSEIWVLGREDNDTDEYDRSVIQHEFAHFLEDTVFRSDSIGGIHSPIRQVDMRVSFSEGLGNAFASMAANSPLYKDTSGTAQASAFTVNMEENSYKTPGYFNEGSIQSMLYDFFDTANDGPDTLKLGFKPIYDTLASSDYKEFSGFTSIYLFMDILKEKNPNESALMDLLLAGQEITVNDKFGTGETVSANNSVSLPLYKSIALNDTLNVCSDNTTEEFNGLDNSSFIRFTPPNSGQYTINVTRSGGTLTVTDPEIELYLKGAFLQKALRDKKLY